MEKKLRNWVLLFLKEDGFDNRLKIMTEFNQFLESEDQQVYEVSGRMLISGKIFGWEDSRLIGSTTIPSLVEKMEKDKHGIRVYSGPNHYFIYMRDADYGVKTMLKDITRGLLCEQVGFYLPRAYTGKMYI